MQPLQYLDGVEDAWLSDLYRQHAPLLLTHLRANTRSLEDAEDILLDVFVAALERESLRALAVEEQRAWLWRVARNKLVDYYRKGSYRQGHVLMTHNPPSGALTLNRVGTMAAGPNPMIRLSGGGNGLEDSSWSPDGKHVVSVFVTGASANYGVEIWNATTGAHEFALACANDWAYGIRDVSWSPDGRYVAAVAPNGHGVCVWRASDGSKVIDIPGNSTQASFSADSKYLAVNQGDTVEIYDLATRTMVRGFQVQSLQGTNGGIYSLAWSPDGKYLAAAGHDVYLLDASRGAVLAIYHPTRGTWVEHLAWSPDSTMLGGEAYILDNPTAFVSAWRVD